MKFKDILTETGIKKQLVGMTSKDEGHNHKAYTDGEGDGETSKDNGHTHKIVNWNLKKAEDGHIHSLKRGQSSAV